MTEDRFEQIMENAGDSIEKSVENVADKFDKSINKAWRHRPVRFIAKTFTFLLGVVLMVSAIPLLKNGQNLVANICLISGILIIAANIAELIIFKRRWSIAERRSAITMTGWGVGFKFNERYNSLIYW